MNAVDQIPQMRVVQERTWKYYVLDTIMAVLGSLLLTAVFFFSHLYPEIPDIVILYLLLVVPLAIWRSRYSAIIAALVSSLAFDFFLVPPLYTLSMARAEEWVALVVFLITALTISQLAGVMRRESEEARSGQLKLRILFEVLRVCNLTDNQNEQLDTIALSTVRIFSSWGARACAILLPDQDGRLVIRADAPIRIEPLQLTTDELKVATSARQRGSQIALHEENEPYFLQLFIPLMSETQILGVLFLRIQTGASWLESEEIMRRDLAQDSPQAEFFWTYLDQISSLIERSLLYSQLKKENQ
jgi:K+-sensing histidine kinase KdpD